MELNDIFTFWLLYAQQEKILYWLDRNLGGPQKQFGLFEEKISFVPTQELKPLPRPSSP